MQIKIEKFMRLALELAKKARGETFPNPLVGAVIVKKNKVIGKGFHRKAGGLHAEIFALRQAGSGAKGATLYCTLEPCAHFGRTGPCVEEIIKAGIQEVCIGIVDPNPLTKGRGIQQLRKAGVRVHTGFLEDEINSLNEDFIKAMTKGLPLVTIKIAESLDGKIATSNGESQWITGEQSRDHAHGIRRFYDAIMVGLHTVLKDNPRLEPIPPDTDHRLTKIVVDSKLVLPLSARLFKTKQPVIIAAIRRNKAKERKLRERGVSVLYTQPKEGKVGLKELLTQLNRLEIRSILVEGGAELIGSFLDQKLADKALVFIAPKIIGGRRALSSVGGEGIRRLSEAICFENESCRKIGKDILIEGYLKYG